MIRKLRDFADDYLLAPHLRRDAFVVKKARLLGWIHVVSLLTAVFLFVSSIWVQPGLLGPIAASIILMAVFIVVYRRYGNLIVSGNLLVGLIAAGMLSTMFTTGGLYSDNLMWMTLVPIIAFLFTSRAWGMVWSVAVVLLLVTLYVLEVNAEQSYRFQNLALGAEYFFVSYLGLFAGLFGTILLFVRGNDDILAMLRRTTIALGKEKRRVEDQNRALTKQERELKRSNRDLEVFAYVASHDLKEPLRMINSYTQVLQRNVGPTLSLKDQEYMGYVREGASRMQVMLDDLLAYSRLGREHGEDKPVDLAGVLQIVRNNLKVRLEETGGEILDNGDLPSVLARPTQLVQVFQNLIANALKFHREGVPPRVRVTTRPDGGGGEFVIAIEDNGIGIRGEDLGSIFGVFQRLHSRDRFEGSGIGLATVQRIVDGLGGRIEVASVVGEGSTFQIALPGGRLVDRDADATRDRRLATERPAPARPGR